jgi:hypothetical protein
MLIVFCQAPTLVPCLAGLHDVSESMHGVKSSPGLYTGITTLTLSMRLTLSQGSASSFSPLRPLAISGFSLHRDPTQTNKLFCEVGGRDVRAADLSKRGASAASTSPSGEPCAGGDGGTTLFRSVSSDEDGGNPANIAASGASNQTR